MELMPPAKNFSLMAIWWWMGSVARVYPRERFTLKTRPQMIGW